MISPLCREDWDFAGLEKDEWLAALRWEIQRECPDTADIVAKGKAWLDGKLPREESRSTKKMGGKGTRIGDLSPSDRASIAVGAVFQQFIPWGDHTVLHRSRLEQRRREHDRWLARHLRPLIDHFPRPWLCFPHEERRRIVAVMEANRRARVVSVPNWWDAMSHFQKTKTDAGLPLAFSHDFGHSNTTTLLLRIEWTHSRKRIRAAIDSVLDEYEPDNVNRWNRRGHKYRDRLVALERLGMMRLLHHYTLSEIRLKVSDAATRYAARKWYDERRQGLKDFRRLSLYAEPEKYFPVSWETKAQRGKRRSEVPGK